MTVALCVLLVVAGTGLWFNRRRRARSGRDPRRELASVAMHLARGTRLGMTPAAALAEASLRVGGSVSAELDVVNRDIGNGSMFEDAMRGWSERSRTDPTRGGPCSRDVELLSLAARFAQRHGSGLPEVFEGVSVTLIDRVEVAEELSALTSQARASVAVLCGLPVLGVAMVSMIDPSIATTLFRSRLGWACLAVAALLDGAAVLLANRLAQQAIG